MKSKLYYIYLGIILIVALFLTNSKATAQGESSERATIMQHVIDERPLLAELMTTAGLAPILSGNTAYTLLTPPEAQLQALKSQPVEKIKAVLAMHLIKGSFKTTDFKDGGRIQNYSGATLNVCRKKNDTLVNGVRLGTANKTFRNGIVIELEGVLLP